MAESNEWRFPSIGRLLNNAQRRFETRVFDLLAQAGHSEARISHLTLTRNLDVGGTRATELARRAGVSKQAMAELISECVERGILTREPDPTDARAKIVKFTPYGFEWFLAFQEAVERAEAEIYMEFGSLRIDGLKAVLMAYGGALDTLARTTTTHGQSLEAGRQEPDKTKKQP